MSSGAAGEWSSGPLPSNRAAVQQTYEVGEYVVTHAISFLTLIGTLAPQYFGRSATTRDTEKTLGRTLAQQREQLDRTLTEQSKQLDRTLAEPASCPAPRAAP
jgi:hypothetical protein